MNQQGKQKGVSVGKKRNVFLYKADKPVGQVIIFLFLVLLWSVCSPIIIFRVIRKKIFQYD